MFQVSSSFHPESTEKDREPQAKNNKVLTTLNPKVQTALGPLPSARRPGCDEGSQGRLELAQHPDFHFSRPSALNRLGFKVSLVYYIFRV